VPPRLREADKSRKYAFSKHPFQSDLDAIWMLAVYGSPAVKLGGKGTVEDGYYLRCELCVLSETENLPDRPMLNYNGLHPNY